MKITFTDASKSEIVGFIVDEGGKLPAAAQALDDETGGLLSEAANSGRFSGKSGQQAFVVLPKGSSAKRAALIGGGKAKGRDDRAWERIGASAYKAHANSGFKSLDLHIDDADNAARAALGAKLAAYRFDTYRTKLKTEDKPSLNALNLVTADTKGCEGGIQAPRCWRRRDLSGARSRQSATKRSLPGQLCRTDRRACRTWSRDRGPGRERAGQAWHEFHARCRAGQRQRIKARHHALEWRQGWRRPRRVGR